MMFSEEENNKWLNEAADNFVFPDENEEQIVWQRWEDIAKKQKIGLTMFQRELRDKELEHAAIREAKKKQ